MDKLTKTKDTINHLIYGHRKLRKIILDEFKDRPLTSAFFPVEYFGEKHFQDIFRNFLGLIGHHIDIYNEEHINGYHGINNLEKKTQFENPIEHRKYKRELYKRYYFLNTKGTHQEEQERINFFNNTWPEEWEIEPENLSDEDLNKRNNLIKVIIKMIKKRERYKLANNDEYFVNNFDYYIF